MRPGGIPLVAPTEYHIYAQCADETGGSVPTLCPEELTPTDPAVFVDARSQNEHRRGHIGGALCVPFCAGAKPAQDVVDYLQSCPEPIVVYGNGGVDDAGLRLALMLMEMDVPDVHVLDGGFGAWRAAGHPVFRHQDRAGS